MEDNNEMSGKDLATEKRMQVFIQEQKELIELCKSVNNKTIESNGYRVEFNQESKSYKVFFSQTNILLSIQDKNGKFDVYPESINTFNRLAEEAEKQGLGSLDKPVGLVENEELKEFIEKQKTTENKKEEMSNIKEEDIKEKPETENKEDNSKQKTGRKIEKPSNLIPIENQRKIDERYTFEKVLRTEFPEQMKDAKSIYIARDSKDWFSYSLCIEKKDGTFEKIPLKQPEGRNPMHEDVITYEKDGNNTKVQNAISILQINPRMMIMIFDGKKNYTSVHIANRSKGDNYHSHKISEVGKEKEIPDANRAVREATSSITAEQIEGDKEKETMETLLTLESQNVPDKINPAKDQDKIQVAEVENYDSLQEAVRSSIIKEYGLKEETAECIAKKILEEKMKFEEALQYGLKEQYIQEEENGTRMSGSAARAAEETTEKLLNGDEQVSDMENEEKEPTRR